MKDSNQFLLKTGTIVSLLLLLIPLSIYALWIYAFNLGTTQTERVSIFNRFFPDFFQGRWDIAYLSIAFCVLTIILSGICLKNSVKSWRILNIILLIFATLMLSLNLFSMM